MLLNITSEGLQCSANTSNFNEYSGMKRVIWMMLKYCCSKIMTPLLPMSRKAEETLISTSIVTSNIALSKSPDLSLSSDSAVSILSTIDTSNYIISITPHMSPHISPLSTDIMNCTCQNMMFTQIGVYSFLSLSLFISLFINLVCIIYVILRRHSKKASFSDLEGISIVPKSVFML